MQPARLSLAVVLVMSFAPSCDDRDPVGRSVAAQALPEEAAIAPMMAPVRSPSTVSALEVPKDRCPRSMILVPTSRFCIHRWEAQMFHENGQLHDPFRVPPFPREMGGMYAKAFPGVVPQGYVGRDQAELACRNAGFRLCTVEEWQSACRGPKAAMFPYGTNHRVDGRCNTHKFPDSEHLVLYFYPDAKWTTQEMNDPRINQFPDGLATTGHYVQCTNAYGVFDMVGNLQEWVADLVEDGKREGNAIALGDHYMGQGKNFEGCEARNVAHDYHPDEPERNQRDYSTGFRCCADPRSF